MVEIARIGGRDVVIIDIVPTRTFLQDLLQLAYVRRGTDNGLPLNAGYAIVA